MAALELRELGGDVLVEALVADPSLHRLALGRAGQLEDEEDLGLVQDLLVDLLGPLGEERRPDPEVPAEFLDPGPMVEHHSLLLARVLRNELLRLLDEDVQRRGLRLLPPEQPIPEVGDETSLGRVGLELRDRSEEHTAELQSR